MMLRREAKSDSWRSVPTCSGAACNVSVPQTPVSGYSYPYSLPSAAGTEIWNATPGSGNNKTQIVTVVFGSPVAANKLAGTYTTTLNLAVADGP